MRKKYFVYILECADHSYYCGYTTDLTRRVGEHNLSKKGSKYTNTRKPVILRYFEEFDSLSESLKREHQIKKLSHKAKIDLLTK